MTEEPPSRDAQTDSVAQLMLATAKPRCMEVELAGVLYALDVEDVKEVVPLKPVSKVFHAPAAIFGVINLRGEVLTVVDLSILLAGHRSQLGPAVRIAVLRDRATARQAGLLVDRLGVLREMPASGLRPAPSTLAARTARLISGVIADCPVCSVLDVNAIFRSPELRALALDQESE